MALPAGRRSDALGATVNAEGTTFALHASGATAVRVVLVDADGSTREFALPEHRDQVWRGFIPGVRAGQRYGFRVSGPWDPARGLRHNDRKLLIDPYTRAVDGALTWGPAVYDNDVTDPTQPSTLDSLGSVPLSVVVDPASFDWSGDRRPDVDDSDRVIYETHVRGMTKEHPDVPAELRGTYAAMALPAVTSHLRRLGVNCVEVLPTQAGADRHELEQRGLTNYWRYDTIAWGAPEGRYAAARDPLAQVDEFKAMVKAMHQAGLEVIVDIVYNHTVEGNLPGPSLSLRGIDNTTYYQLAPDARAYVDLTGCGNTVASANLPTHRLILDTMRRWVEEYHVDGFRFDEASAVARRDGIFDQRSSFFASVLQDPVLRNVRLITESWDAAPQNNYQLGNFPPGFQEWNARYRDGVRDFWRGAAFGVGDLAQRLGGSQDIFGAGDRGPTASINFVTCHDGFTLRDLVSYSVKHNQANGENNTDGPNDNRSDNYGVEGPTADPGINALRAQQQRNMIATLFLSQGTPMLLGGDELNRTQGGNNNPYNQDNATSWFDWAGADAGLRDFTQRMIELRAANPVLRRSSFLRGGGDCRWLREDGTEMVLGDWQDGGRRSLGLLLDGDGIGELAPDGSPRRGDTLLLLFHAGTDPTSWRLPAGEWEVAADTAAAGEADGARRLSGGDGLAVQGRSVVVLRRVRS